jgi:hypothetical protein
MEPRAKNWEVLFVKGLPNRVPDMFFVASMTFRARGVPRVGGPISVVVGICVGNDNGTHYRLTERLIRRVGDLVSATHGCRDLWPTQSQWNMKNCADIAQVTMVFCSGCERDR